MCTTRENVVFTHFHLFAFSVDCGNMGGGCQNNSECRQLNDNQFYCSCVGAWTGEFCNIGKFT